MTETKCDIQASGHDLQQPCHPFPSGYIFQSPGAQFSYQVVGPCCRLFDREQLPWPCCRLQWRGKEPSWRRIGRRLIVDLSTKRYPSYSVELIGYSKPMQPMILTLYTQRLSAEAQDWWHTKKLQNVSGDMKEKMSTFESDSPG